MSSVSNFILCDLLAARVNARILVDRRCLVGGFAAYPAGVHMPGDNSNKLTSLERLGAVLSGPRCFFGHSLGDGRNPDNVAERICRTKRPDTPVRRGEERGKESLARWIHSNSEYGAGEFVKVELRAAIPGTLLESELFRL